MRPRRTTGRLAFTLLRPLLRYSNTRNAWILRLVGQRRGPVIKKR